MLNLGQMLNCFEKDEDTLVFFIGDVCRIDV